MSRKTNMVWIDMEMTGLDPEKNRIIEIATIITDKRLNIIAEGPNLIIHQPQSVLKRMDNWNKKQHKQSGLLDAVKESKLSVKQAESSTLKFIKKHCEENYSSLCGNSIYHDRRFLIKYMPRIDKYLHYRLVDVSTIKVLATLWNLKAKKYVKQDGNHRALADIRESINELKHYRRVYFK